MAQPTRDARESAGMFVRQEELARLILQEQFSEGHVRRRVLSGFRRDQRFVLGTLLDTSYMYRKLQFFSEGQVRRRVRIRRSVRPPGRTRPTHPATADFQSVGAAFE